MNEPSWGPYPIEGAVEGWLAEPVAGWTPSGLDRSVYLDLAEQIVDEAPEWQATDGCVLDPYEGLHAPTCTPRYVGAVAGLIGAGRRRDLLDSAGRAFDWCVEYLMAHQNRDPVAIGGEFYTKELGFGFAHLAPLVEPAVRARWREGLRRCSPAGTYTDLRSESHPEVHNFNIYALSGEAWRARYDLYDRAAALAFIDENLPLHWGYVTDYGMYRDPGDPMTYDLSVRQNLTMLLAAGYDGRWRAAVDEWLRRGGLTTLLFTAPDGLAPYGGRSNQFHHMEGMIACIAEWEARRHAALGRTAVAGAFKRLGRLAVAATAPWLEQRPFRQLKNSFDPITVHGLHESGQYSVYGLLAASLFTMAYHLADERIPEAPTPADAGGIGIELPDAFHKVYATCGGHHVAIDTRADLGYDATGLGRVMRAGWPASLGLGMPCCGRPRWRSCIPEARTYAAIGPVWRSGDGPWRSLAEQGAESIVRVTVQWHERRRAGVKLSVTWEGDLAGASRVSETVTLTSDGVVVESAVELADGGEVGFVAPLLVSDGARRSRILETTGGFTVTWDGWRYEVGCEQPAGARASRLRTQLPYSVDKAANPNGVYHLGCFESPGARRYRVALRFGRG